MRALPVVTGAAATFCAALIYLALQVRAGADPAIGAGTPQAQAPQRVVVKRIVVRRIVEVPRGGAAPGGSTTATSSGAAVPAVRTSAPAPAPAAPAAAPAPAPAPAPAVTRAS
jgi:hypothetical protein